MLPRDTFGEALGVLNLTDQELTFVGVYTLLFGPLSTIDSYCTSFTCMSSFLSSIFPTFFPPYQLFSSSNTTSLLTLISRCGATKETH